MTPGGSLVGGEDREDAATPDPALEEEEVMRELGTAMSIALVVVSPPLPLTAVVSVLGGC